MKKSISILLAIYFLLGSLFPKMDFHQFIHLADAVEHFNLHQSEAAEMGTSFTYIDFIMDHYLDPDNHEHKEGNDHEKLPCTHSHSNTIDYVEINQYLTDFSTPEDKDFEQKFNLILSLSSADFTSGLDQPPATV